jgi:8-oxo-dGTP pyrophosphatase MutT (NUDIX family)
MSTSACCWALRLAGFGRVSTPGTPLTKGLSRTPRSSAKALRPGRPPQKRGFGAGKLNGFGGKCEPGETLLEAAVREMAEESGVAVTDAAQRGRLRFDFEGVPEVLEVAVFRATRFQGQVAAETEEMVPQW